MNDEDPLAYLRGEVSDSEEGSDSGIWSGVLLCLEQEDERLSLIAQEIAGDLGVHLEKAAISSPDDIEKIALLINEKRFELILFGGSSQCLEIAARIAQKLKTGLVEDCAGLEVDGGTRSVLMSHPIYGGKMREIIRCKTRPQMAVM